MNQRLAALDFITTCLGIRGAPEVDEHLRSIAVSGRLDWRILLDLAHAQKIAPALWVALRNRKMVEHLPAEARERLFKTYLLNTLKNKGLREQAITAVRQINAIGVEPILLKGGISLFVKTFDDPGSRVMVDLDILVPKTSAEACWNALLDIGYLPIADNPHCYVNYQNHHHLRPLYRPGEQGAIELHRDALPNSAARILPTQRIWDQAGPVVDESGIALRVPSPTYRVLHNLLHADLINQTHVRGLTALRSLHELAMMQRLYRERLDWETMRRLMERGGQGRVLRASLYLAHRYFGSPLPDCMRPTPGAIAHHARTRLQIRWPWLDEFVERLFWFSTLSIRERYHCDDRFWSVTRGRLHLVAQLACKYSSRAFRWIRCPIQTILVITQFPLLYS